MKVIFKFVIVAALCVGSAGVALGAPTFDIDFYGGSTSLAQGTYDTGTDLSLAAGESVSKASLEAANKALDRLLTPDPTAVEGKGGKKSAVPLKEESRDRSK